MVTYSSYGGLASTHKADRVCSKPSPSQAVIAIENVRLFQELQERTRELVRSVGELKALGEVGQAVSSTLDLETVLNPHRLPRRSTQRNRRWGDLRIR